MSHLLETYKNVISFDVVDQLEQLSANLHGIKIVHVNSTKQGGGVAEILQKMVPMMEALHLDARWEVLEGDREFFSITKHLHNAFQGDKILISPAQWTAYEKNNEINAERLRPILEDADIVIIHDPQPLPLIKFMPNKKGKWIWRCHIDASKPFRPVWNHVRQYIHSYDATIFSLVEFARPLPIPQYIIPPSIDPLSEKNRDLSVEEISSVYSSFQLDPERPILLQVSRFDRFKDPIGVIQAYHYTKKFHPTIQLVLAGSSAADDPEGDIVLTETQEAAKDDPDIHLLLLPPDAHRMINALQRSADIILQKSVKEGFGLTVTEAMWKKKPVIGGNTGGIRLQIIDGKTGYLVNTPEGASARIRLLLQHPKGRKELGQNAHHFVKLKFLNTRHLRSYLTLIHSLLHSNSDRIELDEEK